MERPVKQAAPGNAAVSREMALFFGSKELADCSIVFVSEDEIGVVPKRLRLNEDPQGVPTGASCSGVPLPGHLFLLCAASSLLKAKYANKQQGQLDALSKDIEHPLTSSSNVCGPVLRVAVKDADEERSARAVIEFAYTGLLPSGASIKDVVLLLRQAAHLGVASCEAACIKHLLGLYADNNDTNYLPRIAELYACKEFWPDASSDPASSQFAKVHSAAKRQLLAKFGNTLHTLNNPTLVQQLLSLPAAVLEALLESDEFGTDTEDSVLLLLATWMRENRGGTDAETRERLCRLVRLAQLSPLYVTITKALAADYENSRGTAGDGQGPGWFSIDRDEQAMFGTLASVNRTIRHQAEKEMLQRDVKRRHNVELPPWSFVEREQCLAHGDDYDWSITEQQLHQALSGLQPGGSVKLWCTFENNSDFIVASGLKWKLYIEYHYGAPKAGLYLWCDLPDAYNLEGSEVNNTVATTVTLTRINATALVYAWDGGEPSPADCSILLGTCSVGSEADGAADVLPLKQRDGPDGNRSVTEPWAAYLREGTIQGFFGLRNPWEAE